MREALTDIPLDRLPAVVADLGLKRFAAEQILQWLYRRRVSNFDEMTNLTKEARAMLAERYDISAVEPISEERAADGTRKFLCALRDGNAVECVIIPAEDGRVTVCVSTQVGCAMGCVFCRTAGMGFVRDLTQGEILGQLIQAFRESPEPVTNVVLMGMGEPLANLDAVSTSVEAMLDTRAFGLSKRRVTLSTSGLLPQLDAFSRRFDIKIAISLNAATDEVRQRLMPIDKRYPISQIMDFCRDYSKRTRHRVTFEYVMILGVNDSMEEAKKLAALLAGMRAKVNLIPFNPFEGSEFKAPLAETVERWGDILRESGVQVNIRVSRGQDILAACGQLASLVSCPMSNLNKGSRE
ncbi:MAG: 23S rRNA (adenine(2503)-C(2))-methyltransferase RlmN [bacterium]